ncbi:uncharacterized protein [Dysidea avara]|uniref:uncharacterized protein n=1 Tax=Dysidea avara TaxID=196820 RepID=UPI003325ABE9
MPALMKTCAHCGTRCYPRCHFCDFCKTEFPKRAPKIKQIKHAYKAWACLRQKALMMNKSCGADFFILMHKKNDKRDTWYHLTSKGAGKAFAKKFKTIRYYWRRFVKAYLRLHNSENQTDTTDDEEEEIIEDDGIAEYQHEDDDVRTQDGDQGGDLPEDMDVTNPAAPHTSVTTPIAPRTSVTTPTALRTSVATPIAPRTSVATPTAPRTSGKCVMVDAQ